MPQDWDTEQIFSALLQAGSSNCLKQASLLSALSTALSCRPCQVIGNQSIFGKGMAWGGQSNLLLKLQFSLLLAMQP